MKIFFLISFLFYIFAATAFVVPKLDEQLVDVDVDQSISGDCINKYKDQLTAIQSEFLKELKACASAGNIKECTQDAILKAQASGREVVIKIKECIEEGSKSEAFLEEIDSDIDDLSSKDSVRRDCWRKHRGELSDIRKNLKSELKECKLNEDPKACVKAALAKARAAALAVRNKIKKCIEEGSKAEKGSEAFLEEIDSDIDDLSSKDSVRRECWRKHRGELSDIRKNLKSELKECKINDPKDCVKAALAKARAAALAVRNKINKCIEEGSKAEKGSEAFLEEIDSDIDDLSSKDSVRRECWRKHRGELSDIRKNLRSELKECKLNEDPKACVKAARAKARAAVLAVRNKIKKCIEEGSKPEESSKPEEGSEAFLEEIDSDIDGLSLKCSVRRECWRKHRGEISDIRKNLKSELKECKLNEDPKACVKAAHAKARAAALAVRNKIKKCIEEGSKPEEGSEAFLEEIDSDIDNLSSKDSVRRQCWNKFKGELVTIKKNLISELEACKATENRRKCIIAALSKARAAALEVRTKIIKCIKDGSTQPE